MEVIDITVRQLFEAGWNANQMDEEMLVRLKESLRRYGVVENLVVRPLREDCYEVLSGNQRVRLIREMGFTSAPCFVVHLDDPQARLLAQAMNHLRGRDDLGLRAEMMRDILRAIPQSEVMAVLPDTAESLTAMASMRTEDVAEHLRNWEKARAARLRNIIFKMTADRKAVVDQAMAQMLPRARELDPESPNIRGVALYLLCEWYLGWEGQ